MKRLLWLLLAVVLVSGIVQAEAEAAYGRLSQRSQSTSSVEVEETEVLPAPQPAPKEVIMPVSQPKKSSEKSVVASLGGGGGGGGEGVPGPCPCCGIIWHADNQENGETYGESPIGGLSETCWIVGQVWTDTPTTERWTFAIRPGTVVWFRGHRGGTAWNFSGDEAAVWEDIKKQARELEERDGPMTTGILMLPDQESLMRIVVKSSSS